MTAAAVGAAGCGSHDQDPTRREAAYVTHVNRIESQLVAPLQVVTRASAQFGSPGTHTRRATRAQEAAVLASLQRIRQARAWLRALPAPAAATRLQALLLRLVNQQAYLTQQTARLIIFLPTFSADMRPLGPATVRLERVLGITQASGATAVQAIYGEKAAALRSFHDSMESVLARLRRLHPPTVSLPQYRAQISSLTGMAGAAGRLAVVIASGQTTAVVPLLTSFDRAAVAAQTRTVQRAQAAAVRAYDAQVGRVNSLAIDAERERLRLSKSLR